MIHGEYPNMNTLKNPMNNTEADKYPIETYKTR